MAKQVRRRGDQKVIHIVTGFRTVCGLTDLKDLEFRRWDPGCDACRQPLPEEADCPDCLAKTDEVLRYSWRRGQILNPQIILNPGTEYNCTLDGEITIREVKEDGTLGPNLVDGEEEEPWS